MSTTAMRALVFDEPAPDARATHVRVIDQPVPAGWQVAIDVAYAGINFKDVMARRGDPGYVASWPFVPGLEAAGTIRALGTDVTGLELGQRVVAFTDAGGLAEVATAAAALVAPVPDGLDLAAAAAAPGALTTALLLIADLTRVRGGEVVLVHSAAGGVGQAAAQLARSKGARLVLGTVGDQRRVDAARAAGYDAVFVRDGGLLDAIEHTTDGHGVDAILDPQGTAMLDLDLQVAAPGARIVLFGNASGSPLGRCPSDGSRATCRSRASASPLSPTGRRSASPPPSPPSWTASSTARSSSTRRSAKDSSPPPPSTTLWPAATQGASRSSTSSNPHGQRHRSGSPSSRIPTTGATAPSRGAHRSARIDRASAPSRHPWRRHHVLPSTLGRVADDPFRLPARVAVGGVDQAMARVDEGSNDALGVDGSAARGPDRTEVRRRLHAQNRH